MSGSLRGGSTNAALLLTAQQIAPAGVTAVIYEGSDGLPHFNPDHDQPPLNAEVEGVRSAIGEADAIMFCTPEYAGALPGSFKNLLDWTVGDDGLIHEPSVRAGILATLDALVERPTELT